MKELIGVLWMIAFPHVTPAPIWVPFYRHGVACYTSTGGPIGSMWGDRWGFLHCRETYDDGHSEERVVGWSLTP
jgi:hypothetical protein